jgi:hypothetical protein
LHLRAPNNTDAATCYLIRTEHWIWNKNILPYPSQNIYEIYYNHFPQFFLVNMRLLSGSDYFSAFFQFSSYIGCALAASSITEELGFKGRKAQVLSFVFCLSLPVAVLQSTTVMYDLQSAFFAMLFVLFALRMMNNHSVNFLKNCLLMALSFSFTSYTKYSALFFILPFAAWIFVWLWRANFKLAAQFATVMVIIFLSSHILFFTENHKTIGGIVTPIKEYSNINHLVNEDLSAFAIIGLLIKNISLNLVTPLNSVNNELHSAVVNIHSALGIDVNDSRWSIHDTFEKYSGAFSEATSGNFLAMCLLFLVVPLLFILLKRKKNQVKRTIVYFIVLITGFIVFCSVFRYQQWNPRLQLPFFLLTAPVISIVFSEVLNKYHFTSRVFAALLILGAMPFIFLNYNKPIISYYQFRNFFGKPPTMIPKNDLKKGISLSNAGLDQNLFLFYDSLSPGPFYTLKNDLDANKKKSALEFLNTLNFFNSEKSIFQKTRNEMYLKGFKNSFFLLNDYKNIAIYLDSITNSQQINVGLVFNNFPEYPLLAMLRDLATHRIPCRHISYLEVLYENRNYTEKYFYNTIITNSEDLLSKLNKENISQIKFFGAITVIHLIKPSAEKYKLDKTGKYFL